MRITRAIYKDKDGKKAKSQKWYIDFTDHLGRRHKIPAFENRRSSEALGRQIEQLVTCRISGEPLDAKLEQWLNDIPDTLMKKFVSWGMVSGQRAESAKPLSAHLQDYIQVLKARHHSNDYVQRMESRANKILKDCRFVSFRDITRSAIELYMGRLKKDGYGATSRSHYLGAMKTFLNWMKEDGRIINHPLETMRKESRDEAKKGILTPEQFIALIQKTVENNLIIQTTSGLDRAILYFLASCTGLRRRELLLLTWEALHLDEEAPFVLVRGDITKNAKEARQPIPAALAQLLDRVRAQMRPTPTDRIFGGFALSINTAMLIREDMKAAKLGLTEKEDRFYDREGNEVCFHSLRNSYISYLAAGGASIKTVQKLARHSDPRLSFNTYARSLEQNEQEAINILPVVGQFCFTASLPIGCDLRRFETVKDGKEMGKEGPKTAFLAQKDYPQGDSNPCYRDENPAS